MIYLLARTATGSAPPSSRLWDCGSSGLVTHVHIYIYIYSLTKNAASLYERGAYVPFIWRASFLHAKPVGMLGALRREGARRAAGPSCAAAASMMLGSTSEGRARESMAWSLAGRAPAASAALSFSMTESARTGKSQPGVSAVTTAAAAWSASRATLPSSPLLQRTWLGRGARG